MDRSPQRRRGDPPRRPAGIRRSREVYRRRRFVALVAGIAIVALVAYGVYALAGRESSGATVSATKGSAAAAAGTAGTKGGTSTDPGTDPTEGGAGAGAGSTTEDTSPLDKTPQSLDLETSPTGADVRIGLQDGTSVTGETPFSETIPGGRITVDVSKDGYNPVSRKVALTGTESLKIWLDPTGQIYESTVRFKCGKQPKQLLFTPDGKELWIAILGGGKTGLEAYDPATGKQLAAINLGDREGTELTMTSDGKTIFVSQMATSTIWEVDRKTRKVVRSYKSGGSYTKILLLSRDEKLLYASNWKSNDVTEIDVKTGKVKRTIPVVDTPRALYITEDSKHMYVSGFGKGELQKIDLATGKGKVIYETGGTFRHMAADEKRNLLYVGEFTESAVYVCDMTTDEVRKLCDTDQRPNTIELGPDGNVLYVSNRGEDNPDTGYLTKGYEWGTVLAIDAATGKLLDAIVGGNQCTGLDVSPDGTLLAFSDFLDHVIRIYRIPDYETLLAGDGGRADAYRDDVVKDVAKD